jgi:hypothetical protein
MQNSFLLKKIRGFNKNNLINIVNNNQKGGDNVVKDVKCEVNSCTFWAQGNGCNADSIYVVANSAQAKKSEETDCKTFKRK